MPSLPYSCKKWLQDGCCELWVCLEELCVEVVLSCSFTIIRDLIALIISSFSWAAKLMSRSSAASGMSAFSSGGGLFRISLKRSVQRSSCSPFVVGRNPCLSLMMTLALAWYFPQMSFVMLCTVPCWLRFAASSASAARPSMYAHLSALVRRLTCRSVSLYCCW